MNRRVLLIIGGGIAAYKALELIRIFRRRGVSVTPLLTKGAEHFITPLSAAALAGEKAHDALFSLTDEVEMGHIELSRAADLIVVAPATADLMARAAAGLADDLATTVLLATDAPVLMAPAMNVRMWQHAATQANLATLKARGVHFVGPDVGDMACGETGPGRMAEPQAIAATALEIMAAAASPAGTDRPLAGARVLITSGPTREPIDPVRYIANRSSGRQGHALAEAARDLGAQVVLVSGPVAIPAPHGVEVISVETAREMLKAVRAALPADIAVFAAAVADWRVRQASPAKLKKGATPPHLELEKNPDILATIARLQQGRPAIVAGFAAETDDLLANAERKLREKGADFIIANDVSPESGTFGGSHNQVHILSPQGIDAIPRMDKHALARLLMERFARAWHARRGQPLR